MRVRTRSKIRVLAGVGIRVGVRAGKRVRIWVGLISARVKREWFV